MRMNLSPDDVRPRTSEALRNSNDSNERVDTRVTESYFASVYIPSYVYWARAVSPSLFPELVVCTPRTTPNPSPQSTLQQTSPVNLASA